MRTLLLSVLLAATAHAQAPADTVSLAPGDPTLTTDWLAPGTRGYTLKLLQPMQQDVGTVSETVTVADGRVTRVTTMSVPMRGMTQTDSVVAMSNLVPLAHVSTGGASEVSLEFMDEGVVGLVTPRQGEATTVMLMTDAPVFDGAWVAEIAQSLPFAEGYVARAPVYFTERPDEAGEVVLSVTGQETVGTGDGARLAWTVEGEVGPMTFTYLVDAETRALLETRFAPQPGFVVAIVPAD